MKSFLLAHGDSGCRRGPARTPRLQAALLACGLTLLAGCSSPAADVYEEFKSQADAGNWNRIYDRLDGILKRQIDEKTDDMARRGEIAFNDERRRFAEACRKYPDFQQPFHAATVVEEEIIGSRATLVLSRGGKQERVTCDLMDDVWKFVRWEQFDEANTYSQPLFSP